MLFKLNLDSYYGNFVEKLIDFHISIRNLDDIIRMFYHQLSSKPLNEKKDNIKDLHNNMAFLGETN
jgi:hypothetical protein